MIKYQTAASIVNTHQPLASLQCAFEVIKSALKSQNIRIKVAVNSIQCIRDFSLIIAIMMNIEYVIHGMNICTNSHIILRKVDNLGNLL